MKHHIILSILVLALLTSCSRATDLPSLHDKVKQELLSGNEANAIQFCEKILRIEPADEEAKLTLSFIDLQHNRLGAAEILAQQVIQQNPKNPKAFAILAEVSSLKSDWTHAIEYYKKNLALNPKYTGAHLGLGKAYVSQGRLDEAKQEFLMDQSLWPDKPEAFIEMGNLYLGMNDLEQARQNLVKAIELSGGGRYSDNILSLGKKYHEKGDYKSEYELYKEVLKHVQTIPLEEALKTAKHSLETQQ